MLPFGEVHWTGEGHSEARPLRRSHGGTSLGSRAYKEGCVPLQGFPSLAGSRVLQAYPMVTELECLLSKSDVIPT